MDLKFKEFTLEGEKVTLNQEYHVIAKTNMKYNTLSFNSCFYKTEEKNYTYQNLDSLIHTHS
jgi:hypothetical protein